MKRLIVIACCVGLFSGCADTKGKIERHGMIVISDYEFSDCNKAVAAIEQRSDGRILLCGYTVEDLLLMRGGVYKNLSFSGGTPIKTR